MSLCNWTEISHKQNALNLPAGVKLGGLAIDACSNQMSAVRDLYSLMSGQGLCHGETEVSASNTIVYDVQMTSGTSIAVQVGTDTLERKIHNAPCDTLLCQLHTLPPNHLKLYFHSYSLAAHWHIELMYGVITALTGTIVYSFGMKRQWDGIDLTWLRPPLWQTQPALKSPMTVWSLIQSVT